MSEFFQDTSQLLIVLGIAALIVEVALLGMATLVLLFLGCALILAGLAMTFGLLPESTSSALWSVSIGTALLSLLFWKPMKRMQANTETQTVTSDLIGHEFILEAPVDRQGKTAMQFSGIQWQLKSLEPLAKDQRVKIAKTEVGILWLEPAE